MSEQRRWRFHLGAKKFAPRPCVIAKARKSSPCALKTPQIRRFCACWASYFAERPLEGPCWASIFAPIGTVPVLEAARRPPDRRRWGVCAMRSPLAARRRRVGGLDGVIPPPVGGSWAHLLAVLTLQCAAKPYWWHGGQPAQAATCRAHVRISGLTCASKDPGGHLLDPSARKRAGGRAPAHRPRHSSHQRVPLRSNMKQCHSEQKQSPTCSVSTFGTCAIWSKYYQKPTNLWHTEGRKISAITGAVRA